ncbi:MAG: VOC family protein [Gammaproteobacteria bacterium]
MASTGGFIWYELMTTDPDAAARFYGAVVGWTIGGEARPVPGGPDYRMILRGDGGHAGGVIAIDDEMRSHGAHPFWLAYLQVADVDAALHAIAADGGRTLMPPMDLPVGRIAMVADPLGAPFYVMTPIPPPGQPDARSDVFHPARPQHVRWNELMSSDLARAKAFYAKHFGFEFNEAMPMGELGDYCFIDHAGERLGAMMRKPPEVPMGAWQFYFGVVSVSAAKAAIESGGGTVMMGPHQVPGGEWIVVATDPQGAPIGVVGALGD